MNAADLDRIGRAFDQADRAKELDARQTPRARTERRKLATLGAGAGIPVALPSRGVHCNVECDGEPCAALAVLVVRDSPLCEFHANKALRGGGR